MTTRGHHGLLMAEGAPAPATDPYYSYVTSLQNFEEDFTDEKGITWSKSGTVNIDSSLGFPAAKFTAAGYLYAAGTNAGLQLSNSAPWTQEFWVRTTGTSAYQLLGNLNDNDGSGHYWIILNSTYTGLHTVQFGAQGTVCKFGTSALATGAMTHIELGFDNDPVTPRLRCFIDGTQLGSAQALAARPQAPKESILRENCAWKQ